MATLGATTPSPPPTIHTPPTPKLGYADSWEPYSPRKSARISQKTASTPSAAAARTPSPKSSRARNTSSRPPKFHITRSSDNSSIADMMASPAPSPRKKHHLSKPGSAPGFLTAEGTRSAAVFLGPPSGAKSDCQQSGRGGGPTNISAQAGMLPTPAKTPSRKHTEQNEANIAAIARNLFHSEDEVMPNPKQKKPKKYTGISMDSFTAEDIEEPIEIYTDSHDRVPEVDDSADNPFYGDHPAPAANRVENKNKRKSVIIPGEGNVSVDEALHRSDGLVYVFRGKKIFRKFPDRSEGPSSEGANGEGAFEGQSPRRLTRSSFKPKLLFKEKQPDTTLADDEEADTDIEDHVQNKDQDVELDADPSTPPDLVDKALPVTPEAPKFGPVSPPGTARITRASQKLLDEQATPIKPTRKSRRSPFDSWQRVKSDSDSQSHKRSGEALPPGVESKRARC